MYVWPYLNTPGLLLCIAQCIKPGFKLLCDFKLVYTYLFSFITSKDGQYSLLHKKLVRKANNFLLHIVMSDTFSYKQYIPHMTELFNPLATVITKRQTINVSSAIYDVALECELVHEVVLHTCDIVKSSVSSK